MPEFISNINFGFLIGALLVWWAGFAVVRKPEVGLLGILPLAWNGKRTMGVPPRTLLVYRHRID